MEGIRFDPFTTFWVLLFRFLTLPSHAWRLVAMERATQRHVHADRQGLRRHVAALKHFALAVEELETLLASSRLILEPSIRASLEGLDAGIEALKQQLLALYGADS